MARQFGNFLGEFLDYDTAMLTLGFKRIMRIRTRLDVTFPLKRRKKVQIGVDKTIYARFQYEKLSLFCFICSKLGHGESFCPIWLRIEPTSIIFEWDLNLRPEVRRRGKAESRWLCQSDGSQWSNLKKEDSNQSSKWPNDLGNSNWKESWKQFSNPNLIHLDPGQNILYKRSDSWRKLGSSAIQGNNSGSGSPDLMLEEENEPLLNMEGKKRQRIVEDSIIVVGKIGNISHYNEMASSGDQSSRR
ncbi:hypothetical protein J1N35_013341 [Gossypium stocksii]|uniref:Zinc knuckle CX2CX4HX4C domain-containing protein n=1 Tax=Gossypium stocksii TaxID=47602 RepID=A0A9D3VSL7_9ROSI|nr:hypothetical protein J1N35_013341 [Gossypium stocksii]